MCVCVCLSLCVTGCLPVCLSTTWCIVYSVVSKCGMQHLFVFVLRCSAHFNVADALSLSLNASFCCFFVVVCCLVMLCASRLVRVSVCTVCSSTRLARCDECVVYFCIDAREERCAHLLHTDAQQLKERWGGRWRWSYVEWSTPERRHTPTRTVWNELKGEPEPTHMCNVIAEGASE